MAEVEITPKHLKIVERVASLCRAQSRPLRLIEHEELVSEGMVLLWQIALAYDPGRGAEFEGYLVQQLRWKLTDYARTEVGRMTDNGASAKLNAIASQRSLDEHRERQAAPERGHDDWERDSSPSAEDQVLARDELARTMAAINALPTTQREAMLWPLYEGEPKDSYREQHGLSYPFQRRTGRATVEAQVGERYIRPIGGKNSKLGSDGLCRWDGCEQKARRAGRCFHHQVGQEQQVLAAVQ